VTAFDTSDDFPWLKEEIKQVAASGGGLLEVAMSSIFTLVHIAIDSLQCVWRDVLD